MISDEICSVDEIGPVVNYQILLTFLRGKCIVFRRNYELHSIQHILPILGRHFYHIQSGIGISNV